MMKSLKTFWGKYYVYFIDVWQYLIIIIIFIIASIVYFIIN
ncbi:MAG: hypothetical protein WC389_07435 [Lutibacter sp.]